MAFTDLIEFVVKIRETVSGSSQKMAATAQRAFRMVDDSATRTQRSMNNTSRSVSGLNSMLERLTRRRDIAVGDRAIAQANRQIAEVERRLERLNNLGRSQTRSGGMGARGWLATGAIAATVGAGALGIVKEGAKAQQDIIGLTTFLGAEKAQKTYRNIQADAAATPFGTAGLLSANRLLISAGVNADKARADVLGLANAIAATGGGDDELARMAVNMQQIKNAGKAELTDIKQFGFAGISIYQLLANATGKTVKQAQKMVVSYDLLSFALKKAAADGGMYAGAMDAQGKSIMGKWSTLMDGIRISAASIGMSQSEGITGLIDNLINLTNRLPKMAENWIPAIANIVKHLITFVGQMIDLAKWIYHNWTWIKYVAGVTVTFAAAIKLAGIATAVYNGVMSIMSVRLGAAVVGQLGLNAAMAAMPWGWILTGLTLLGVGLTAWLSSTKKTTDNISKSMPGSMADNLTDASALSTLTDAGKKGGAAYFDGFNSKSKVVAGAHGEGYKNPLAGGHFVADTTTYNLVTVMKDLKDTVGRQEKVYSGNKIWVPAVADTVESPLVKALLKKMKPLSADLKPPIKAPVKPDNGLYTGAVEDKGNSITAGGKKQLVINVNAPMYNVEHQEIKTLQEALDDMEPKVREILMRFIYSAKVAMNG